MTVIVPILAEVQDEDWNGIIGLSNIHDGDAIHKKYIRTERVGNPRHCRESNILQLAACGIWCGRNDRRCTRIAEIYHLHAGRIVSNKGCCALHSHLTRISGNAGVATEPTILGARGFTRSMISSPPDPAAQYTGVPTIRRSLAFPGKPSHETTFGSPRSLTPPPSTPAAPAAT